jgi:hypothetical protein
MPDWIMPLAVLIGYLVLMRWVLPKFGAPT